MSVRVSSASAPPARIRLEFIDGMRALMALWVMLGHIVETMAYPGARSDRISRFLLTRAYTAVHNGLDNHLAVAVFIVLSGYCLAVPVVRSPEFVMPGGVASYFVRRARRILPPYYAAFVFAMVVLVAEQRVEHHVVRGGILGIPYAVFISHAVLVQNWKDAWQTSTAYPLWSIATEWQIYFLLPLLLLPICRRFGIAVGALALMALGRILTGVFHHIAPTSDIMPWFIGLFSLGFATAALSLPSSAHSARPLQYFAVSAVAAAALLVVTATIVDYIVGIATCVLLAHYTRHVTSRGTLDEQSAHTWLENRLLVWIGGFSYSLYLIHVPLLHLLWLPMRTTQSPTVLAAAALVLSPVLILIAYGFHLVFEKPFMSLKPRVASP